MSYQYVSLGKGSACGAQTNQRATIRYQCAPATASRVIAANDHEFQRAWVLDLSTKGIGLSLARSILIGTIVAIQLKSPCHNKTYEFSARVMHTTSLPDGNWLVGCQFTTQISNDDLDALL